MLTSSERLDDIFTPRRACAAKGLSDCSVGSCKTWTGLESGLDYGLDCGLDSGLDCMGSS